MLFLVRCGMDKPEKFSAPLRMKIRPEESFEPRIMRIRALEIEVTHLNYQLSGAPQSAYDALLEEAKAFRAELEIFNELADIRSENEMGENTPRSETLRSSMAKFPSRPYTPKGCYLFGR